MQAPIARHRRERPPGWVTLEEPHDLRGALSGLHGVVLLDCLSLWTSNRLLAGLTGELHGEALLTETAAWLDAAAHLTLLAVSNEVGLGIVPDNALARRYRDLLGRVNQQVAARSNEAWLLTSGLPLRLR